ncbi:MAG: hypothetical protein ACREUA_05915, partial [Burkholderiales bacterium]
MNISALLQRLEVFSGVLTRLPTFLRARRKADSDAVSATAPADQSAPPRLTPDQAATKIERKAVDVIDKDDAAGIPSKRSSDSPVSEAGDESVQKRSSMLRVATAKLRSILNLPAFLRGRRKAAGSDPDAASTEVAGPDAPARPTGS